ncbi:MAG TPA: O-antigen ligase family protein [Oligoflexus sp.]|uniref:O-antigen ligase family protein n=1 Tax=Oligoflexus sp. TaxID=1971216 RepID=UPI002D6B036D|nr:O-antigen ligase family protein [Oligoflexus sp.]HYX33128.1 O-antigen ligase family protein [Oligoflexus sp.]
MNPGKFTLQSKTKGHALWIEMLVFICALALGLFMFMREPLLPLSPIPILAVAAWIILPRLGARSDQIMLLGFFILCFFIDDIAQAPWNGLFSITKDILGNILFRSFGLTGFEVFSMGFALLCVIITRREEKKAWLGLGLVPLLIITSMILLMALVNSFYGVMTGGSPETALIQIRFLYLLPIWTFIGFVVLRDEPFFRKIFFWLTMLIVFKSVQTIFIWITNRGYFAEAEYIYEHYFSAYQVVAMLHLLQYAWRRPEGLLKGASVLGFVLTLIAYILNDRRTSYVGIPFALIALLFFLPKSFMKVYGRMIVTCTLAFGTLTAVTWNLPGPLGFVGALYRSFGQETGQEGPSYRDLENANMLREVSQAPITGMGYGKEFEEFYPMPSVASVYPRYKMIPHNNLLAAWCYGGPLTIAGLSLVFLFMFAMAGRLVFDEDMAGYRYIGIFSLFYFVQFFSYVFGDIGLQVSKNQLLGGLLLGGCYRLYQMRKKELGKC